MNKLVRKLQSRISLRRNQINLKYTFMLFNFEMANSVPEFGRRFFIDNAIDIRKEIKLLSQDQVLDKRLMAAICKAGIQNA